MKTETRNQLLKLIEKAGKIRPSELQAALHITPQAVHYHLRNLVKQGLVEAKGSVPATQYSLAGAPDLDAVTAWVNARTPTQNAETVCETRDVFSSRLIHLQAFIRDGLSKDLLPLVIAATGEIGNNSFDHNSGQWRDVPGCWFQSEGAGQNLWICVADRGQGIFRSLAQAHPDLTNDQAAIEAAFETIISGRSPEQRGNGLKFVKQQLLKTNGALACISGKGLVHYGEQGQKCLALLTKYFTEVKGTITLMSWRLK